MTQSSTVFWSTKRIVAGALSLVAAIIVIVLLATNVTTVSASEICIKQNAIDGGLNYWISPGLRSLTFGRVTRYQKSAEFSFSEKMDQGKPVDESIHTRFNDGGEASISGTLRFELPIDPEHLNQLHTKFGSQEAIERQLIRPVLERSVYMAGPLMSSKESAAEKRQALLGYIEDQVQNGVYRTRSRDEKIKDPLSGQERTVTVVELVADPNAPNGFARTEQSPLADFGIRTYSFNVNRIRYSEDVEKQIQGQQQLMMQVQTAIAKAKEAEQNAITVAKQGEAEAAKAKWEQEVIKARAVTEAEQKRAVAELAVKTADLYKQEQTLIGEGDAARRRAVMIADGALDKKLEAYVTVQKAYAEQIGKQRWVPEVVMGGSGSNGADAATDFVRLMGVKAARDLGLDLSMQQPAEVKK